MASDVGICNLALSRLGDAATVSSIDPPEGSTQADLCATFYPMARDSLLEMHAWAFATRRVDLSLLTAETDAWVYAYAMPTNCLRVLSIQDRDAADDYGVSAGLSSLYVPQPFSVETLAAGTMAILTNQENAAARYTVRITDTSKFTPLFTDALAWLLASYLAGPVIKGMEGIKVGQSMAAQAQAVLSRAITSDSGQRSGRPTHSVPWLAGR